MFFFGCAFDPSVLLFLFLLVLTLLQIFANLIPTTDFYAKMERVEQTSLIIIIHNGVLKTRKVFPESSRFFEIKAQPASEVVSTRRRRQTLREIGWDHNLVLAKQDSSTRGREASVEAAVERTVPSTPKPSRVSKSSKLLFAWCAHRTKIHQK